MKSLRYMALCANFDRVIDTVRLRSSCNSD